MVNGGACVVKGGVHGKGGAYVACTPKQDTAGHCAGGTHPTEMHSCHADLVMQIFGKIATNKR